MASSAYGQHNDLKLDDELRLDLSASDEESPSKHCSRPPLLPPLSSSQLPPPAQLQASGLRDREASHLSSSPSASPDPGNNARPGSLLAAALMILWVCTCYGLRQMVSCCLQMCSRKSQLKSEVPFQATSSDCVCQLPQPFMTGADRAISIF